ncbi:MAG: glycosyltransferase, partial [Ignavibacteriales bacterium]
MKIMIFNTLYFPHIFGGAEKSVQILAEGLADLGHEVVVVSTAPRDDVVIVNKVQVYYVRHRNLYWGGMPATHNRFLAMLWHIIDVCNPYMYRALARIVSNEKPDIIHTNMLTGFSSAPWIVARRYKIPVVHTLREYNLICERMSMFHKDHNCSQQCISCRLATAPKKFLTNHDFVAHVVGLSNFIIHRHQDGKYFSGVTSSRIFNGIKDVEKHHPTARITSTLPIRILYLGRIDKAKG